MRAKGLLCAVIGHRWLPVDAHDPDAHDEAVLLRCSRCRHEIVKSAETFDAEGWLERGARKELARYPHVEPGAWDERLHERRR
jgi:hypothetical protein